MKLLKDRDFLEFSTITASSFDVNFPPSNLILFDPGVVWKAETFAEELNLVIDLGAPLKARHIWLCNANFVNCTIQASSADSWAMPEVSRLVTLVKDRVGILKGFFDLSTSNYRYIRLIIPVQPLAFGSVPQLGNIIIGAASELSVSDFSVSETWKWKKFESDGGSYSQIRKGRGRQSIQLAFHGSALDISSIAFSDSDLILLFADLGDVSESYLVYAPETGVIKKRNSLDAEVSYVLEEKT